MNVMGWLIAIALFIAVVGVIILFAKSIIKDIRTYKAKKTTSKDQEKVEE